MGWGGGGRGGLFIAGRGRGRRYDGEGGGGDGRRTRSPGPTRDSDVWCAPRLGAARNGGAAPGWRSACLPRTDGTVGRTVHGWTRLSKRTFGRARRTCRVKIALVGGGLLLGK